VECLYAHIYTHTHTRTQTLIHSYLVHTCMRTYVYTHINKYIHVFTYLTVPTYLHMWCPLRKRMCMNCTVEIESRTMRRRSWRNIQFVMSFTYLVKNLVFITAWPPLHFSQFVRRIFYKKLKTVHNTTDNNCIISHSQNATTFRSNLFLNGMDRLLVTSKEESAFLGAKHSQGQLETPQLLSAPTYTG
jgi:hypothetical protein